MDVLFLHQNAPGQFKHLAPALARRPGNRIVFVTKREAVTVPGVQFATYSPARLAHGSTHHYLRLFENSVLHGQQVVRLCHGLAQHGFRPDVVVAHPGWGEALFIKDVFPRTRLANYCEFYYRGVGADIGFDPGEPASIDQVCRARARNAHLLLSLESCDGGWSPTRWQKSQHPAIFHPKIEVIFDGIDTETVRPDPAAAYRLPDGRCLTRADEVVTYVARNLEPYRGFPSFVRALPEILRRRPEARVVVVGGDEISYGNAPSDGKTWREAMLAEVAFDRERVHFVGRIPYGDYLRLLQVSSAHVYLTVPFVLSWSCIEALAAGCVVIASRTPPVEEVIEDGRNGLLFDFFSPAEIADRVVEVLADGGGQEALRQRARASVLGAYDLAHCLPRQLRLIDRIAAGDGA
jgi:glycosyltransferase involved in cell wall biosynthesis